MIKKIRNKTTAGKFEKSFERYLSKLGTLGEYIISDEFFGVWHDVLETQVFGSRRHSGSVSKEEVQTLRTQITGNYESDQSMIYQFLKAAQSVDI